MKILFDVGHPAHVHLFKNLAHRFIKDGADVLFTARDKEHELELMRKEGFHYINFGKHYKTLRGKLWGLAKFDTQMFINGLRFKPDVFISHGSIYAAHAAFMLGKKHLAMEDTGNMEQTRLHLPFTDCVLTPEVYPVNLGAKQIRFNGYFEIAYLHPDFFTPDPAIYEWLGLQQGDPYAILRFIAWNATHDIGHKGLSMDDKIRLVRQLSEKMKVFISAEGKLPPELEPYRIKIPPEKFHHALHYASIVISEGPTVASEAGVLGTPAIHISTYPMSYCLDQEKYGLVYNTSKPERVFTLVDEILQVTPEAYQERRQKLLQDKVNVTRYLYDFIVNRYLKNKN
ncbi:MAG: DUF354 domain-containing protein [Saprospiraceae bacterium]